MPLDSAPSGLTRLQCEVFAILSIILAVTVAVLGIAAFLADWPLRASVIAFVASMFLSGASVWFRSRAEYLYEAERKYGMWVIHPR